MKITKSQLRQIIKEEVDTALGTSLEGRTHNFKVSHTDMDGRTIRPAYYLVNVPYNMLDTKMYERLKETHKSPERFLKPSMELLKKAGFDPGGMDAQYMDGDPPPPPKPPPIIDASTLI